MTHCTRRGWGLGALGFSAWLLGLGQAAAQTPASRTGATPARILVVGDSLSAEYGIARGTGWVALLEQRLRSQRISAEVINGSISGETTAGGLSRLPALLSTHQPSHVIIELGGNDALRGWSLKTTEANLTGMVELAQKRGAQVLLVGMQLPPNYGRRYAADFANTFQKVAQATSVPLVPFLLQGVADRADARDWFQSDGIHPLAKAHPVMLDNIWPALSAQLRPAKRR